MTQIFWPDPFGVADLNGGKFSLFDEFIDKSFAAVQNNRNLGGLQ